MNSALHVQRVELPHEIEGLTFGRRVRTIWEIEEFDQYREVAVWNPRTDTFETWFEDSILLERIATSKAVAKKDILNELEARTKFLTEIVNEGVREQSKVAEKILYYYTEKREDKEGKNQKKKKKKKISKGESDEISELDFDDILEKKISDDNKMNIESDSSPELGRAASLGNRSRNPSSINKDEVR
jgi:hypothetical protein